MNICVPTPCYGIISLAAIVLPRTGSSHELSLYICNMGRRDLPHMYAQAQGHAAPKVEWQHIRQIPTAHITYIM